MQEIVFILSSLNDPHYRKRVEEFVEHGYKVVVYGFKRKGLKLYPSTMYRAIILGEIECRNYGSRLHLFNNSIKRIAKECFGKICFYSSLDIALFAHLYIKSPYIYEVCDLTELTISNHIVRKVLTSFNSYTIRKSLTTIITSEGFVEYFSNVPKDKMRLIPNKVSASIPQYEYTTRELDLTKIKIGFVGAIRYETIYHFAHACAEYGKNIELHFYGIYMEADEWSVRVKTLAEQCPTITYHGPFANPNDLPSIYEQIDMVLCTYTPSPSVKYAEPNKLYEAIYFRCPIIVSKDVFLGDKVERMGIGYAINAMDESAIKSFLEHFTYADYMNKVRACECIPQYKCLNVNDTFFDYLNSLISIRK